MSSTLSFSGLATGLDTATIVDQLCAIRGAPISRMQSQQSAFKKQITALNTLKTKLQALQEAGRKIDSATEFSAITATSSNESILVATANGEASPGGHDVIVHSLAQAQRSVSQGLNSQLTLVGSGTMTFNVGGTATDLTIANGTSLRDLANQINDDVDGVNASIVYDGNTSGGYHLVLSGDAGSDGAFTVDSSGLSGGTAPTFTTTQDALDATLTVDGLEITASGNVLDNVISGLTLDLRKAEEGTAVHIETAVDAAGVQDQVQAFVDAYNDVFSFVKTALATGGALEGNSTARTVASRVEAAMSSSLGNPDASFTILAQAGIERTRERTLEFDTTKFADALQDNFAAVRDLFITRDGNSGKAGVIDDMIDQLTDRVDGLFKIGTDALNRKVDSLDDTIARYELSLDNYRTTLERKFTAMESQVSMLQAQGQYLSSLSFNS